MCNLYLFFFKKQKRIFIQKYSQQKTHKLLQAKIKYVKQKCLSPLFILHK